MSPFHVMLVLLVVMVWSINYLFIHIGLKELPPIFLVFARFFFTCFPAIFFVKRPHVPFKLLLGYALAMFCMKFTFLFVAMKVGTSVGLASILLQLQVFFTLCFAALFLRERLQRSQMIGAVVAFSGILVVGINLGQSISALGLILMLASAASFGAGNIICKKMGQINTISLLVWASIIAWPILLGVSCLIEGVDNIKLSLKHVSAMSLVSISYTTLLSTFFAFGVWSFLLQRYPLATVAPFTLLVPILGMLSSAIFLGEPLESWKILSGALVSSGLIINFLGSRRRVLD